MKRDEFVSAFIEGMHIERTTPVPNDLVTKIENLVGIIYEARGHVKALQSQISEMDDIARDSSWHVTCRSCQKDFEPDCELSEIVGSQLYCGGSEWCTP